ncbi:unnamed protein product [Lota lota]
MPLASKPECWSDRVFRGHSHKLGDWPEERSQGWGVEEMVVEEEVVGKEVEVALCCTREVESGGGFSSAKALGACGALGV